MASFEKSKSAPTFPEGTLSSTAPAHRSRAGRILGGVVATALSADLILSGCANGDQADAIKTITVEPTVVAPATTTTAASTPTSHAPAHTYVEIADHRPSLQLWSSNQGSEMSGGSLPLGTAVDVECLAPNLSGMSSANPGFYEFEYEGHLAYGISNEFANGDSVGANGYNTVVDPRVPAC